MDHYENDDDYQSEMDAMGAHNRFNGQVFVTDSLINNNTLREPIINTLHYYSRIKTLKVRAI
jgi:hypothetical protein